MPVPRYALVAPGSPERMGRDLAAAAGSRAVVLVEGASDKAAVEELAGRDGRILSAEGIMVIEMGGATNAGRFLTALGPAGLGLQLAGLFDADEQNYIRGALARTGFGGVETAAEMAAAGFYLCTEDLEDELIRALGVPAVQQIIATEGDLASLRRFERQPAQQGLRADRQLRRFMGTRSGRKSHYARLLVRALGPGQVPSPLARVLARVTG
jgi:hypothetical protein